VRVLVFQINAMEAQVQELLGTQATGGRGLHRQAGAGGLAHYTWAGGAYAAHPPERRFLLQATYLQLPLPPGYTLDQVRTPRLHSKIPDLTLCGQCLQLQIPMTAKRPRTPSAHDDQDENEYKVGSSMYTPTDHRPRPAAPYH
jgi:hypothetical protein